MIWRLTYCPAIIDFRINLLKNLPILVLSDRSVSVNDKAIVTMLPAMGEHKG